MSTPVDARIAALAIMKADMASGKATKRSLGVMYAHIMAGSSCAGPDFWRPINQEIIAYGHAGKDQFAFLEGVKKVAWAIFESVGKEPAIIDAARAGCEAIEPSHPSPTQTKGEAP